MVLTVIGGGVFGNSHSLIWEALCWALDEAKPYLQKPLRVIFNPYRFSVPVGELRAEAERRGGSVRCL